MRNLTFFLLSLTLFLLLSYASAGSLARGSQRKLFVFGDSYADTGNWSPSIASSWKPPYGSTFPGKPSGRFSDGRILTDYVASYFNISSPIPYERRSSASPEELKYGMNFAYGGTGVFDTDVSQPNVTSQINSFNNFLSQGKVYNKTDLESSIGLVTLGGNDYSNYLKHAPNVSLSGFTKLVIHQLVMDLKTIQSLGVPKILVTSMEPLGCLPALTFLMGYKNCSQSLNDITAYHNRLLHKSLDRLNIRAKKTVFIALDLYDAFLTGLRAHQIQPGAENFGYGNSLVPCCQGVTMDYECGSTEGNVVKYTICNKPQLAFFWDKVHPAQNGWHQVFLAIKPTLAKLS